LAYQRVQDLALYTKIHDLALWLFPHIKNFPRAERGILGDQMKCTLLDLLRDVVFAYNAPSGAKREHIEQASANLDLFRLLIRLSADLRLTSVRQYEYASAMVNEIGRMLGGWLASQQGRGRS